VLFVGRARGQTALPGLERLPGIAQVSRQVGDSERQLEALPCRVTVCTGSCLGVPVCHGMGSFRTQEGSDAVVVCPRIVVCLVVRGWQSLAPVRGTWAVLGAFSGC